MRACYHWSERVREMRVHTVVSHSPVREREKERDKEKEREIKREGER